MESLAHVSLEDLKFRQGYIAALVDISELSLDEENE
jgi:hypothetical protein